jgi:predicted nucleotidyltransferase
MAGIRLLKWSMVIHVNIPPAALRAFCAKWRIRKVELFGSVLRDDFASDSDVDFMITFKPAAHVSLFDFTDVEDELKAMVGRDVDLVTRKSVENGRNERRKESILSSAEVVFEGVA